MSTRRIDRFPGGSCGCLGKLIATCRAVITIKQGLAWNAAKQVHPEQTYATPADTKINWICNLAASATICFCNPQEMLVRISQYVTTLACAVASTRGGQLWNCLTVPAMFSCTQPSISPVLFDGWYMLRQTLPDINAMSLSAGSLLNATTDKVGKLENCIFGRSWRKKNFNFSQPVSTQQWYVHSSVAQENLNITSPLQ